MRRGEGRDGKAGEGEKRRDEGRRRRGKGEVRGREVRRGERAFMYYCTQTWYSIIYIYIYVYISFFEIALTPGRGGERRAPSDTQSFLYVCRDEKFILPRPVKRPRLAHAVTSSSKRPRLADALTVKSLLF